MTCAACRQEVCLGGSPDCSHPHLPEVWAESLLSWLTANLRLHWTTFLSSSVLPAPSPADFTLHCDSLCVFIISQGVSYICASGSRCGGCKRQHTVHQPVQCSPSLYTACCCRFDFKLSPGQIPLAVRSPFTLGPAKGIFVTPVLRVEE